MCGEGHGIYHCGMFLKLNPKQRTNTIKSLGLCFKCLTSDHEYKSCTKSSCKICSKPHNTLLHYHSREDKANESTSEKPEKPSEVVSSHAATKQEEVKSTTVFLSTALVYILDNEGGAHSCRVLLDSGSESNFITSEMCQMLKLNSTPSYIEVSGISSAKSKAMSIVNASIKSRFNCKQFNLQFLVLPNLTGAIPSKSCELSKIEIPPSIQLADPEFNRAQKIDVIIGAQVFFKLLQIGQIVLQESLIAHKTVFGWVVSGEFDESTTANSKTVCNFSQSNVEDQIVKFWEIEECDYHKVLSFEEQEVEEKFVSSVIRDEDGRYQVDLPCRDNISELGESKNIALNRFYSMERKLLRQPELYRQYSEFLSEYQSLGHMSEVVDIDDTKPAYYLPHHAVLKPDNVSTKLRVVFDASCKTTTGISLNDVLQVGPVVQPELFTTILKFRLHKYVMSADITKMYRQVRVNPEQTSLQRILWRFDQTEPIKTYELLTVTYGTSSAPYLATRCLKQLSCDEKENYPVAASLVASDFYVDDLLTGCNDLREASVIKSQVIGMLSSACFELHKWCSNSEQLLGGVKNQSSEQIQFDETYVHKTLGISWVPAEDYFTYVVHEVNPNENVTKRVILSHISKIFDPLGLVGPTVVLAKIIIQKLWQWHLDWDDVVPREIEMQWKGVQSELMSLSELRIPRWVSPSVDVKNYELHGFSDASEMAYGACIYIRAKLDDDAEVWSVNLLCAKSKVAPLRTTTVPRLELCGALLLAELVDRVRGDLNISFKRIVLWCDSTIVLAWIASDPSKYKIFVANRVQQIRNLTSDIEWRHVDTSSNPADIISRGATPKQLRSIDLWWHGPVWLSQCEEKWMIKPGEKCKLPAEEEKRVVTAALSQRVNSSFITKRYSNLTRLKRVTAWCVRFIVNSKISTSNKGERVNGELTPRELDGAMTYLTRSVQRECFSVEYDRLSRGESVDKESKLKLLNPLIDSDGLLRVGGRLRHSDLEYNQKHPIILPSSHHLTRLVARYEHWRNFHCGAQLLLSNIRQKYWPLRGRHLVRQIVISCTVCFRANPTTLNQLMGDLPKYRVQQLRAFVRVGVDFCGPIQLRERYGKRVNIIKAYIAVYVCMVTKAIHLELVGDLTTQAFIASLRRFVSRRGLCQDIYSDNGTTFVGANKELQQLFKSSEHKHEVVTQASTMGIHWHFIPPRSPHFGGLWEAGVKSVKYHIKRITGNTPMTYEEYSTLLCQIEGCLNSRPLVGLTEDINDGCALTPGHFLLGTSVAMVPNPSDESAKVNHLKRWQLLQRIFQNFWRTWSACYLNKLQQRSKWAAKQPNLKIGTVVLVKDDQRPTCEWGLGRITELHPGPDGLVRVASVKMSNGVFRRAITKICVLPTTDDVDNENENEESDNEETNSAC